MTRFLVLSLSFCFLISFLPGGKQRGETETGRECVCASRFRWGLSASASLPCGCNSEKICFTTTTGVSLSPVVIVPILTPKLLSLFPLLAGHCRGASSPPAQHGTARDGKTVYACITVRVCAALTVSSLLLFSSCLIMCVCAGNNHAWIYCHFTSFFYRAECIVDPVETKAERKGNDNN